MTTHANTKQLLHQQYISSWGWHWPHKVEINANITFPLLIQLVVTMLQWIASKNQLVCKGLTSMQTWASFHYEPMPTSTSCNYAHHNAKNLPLWHLWKQYTNSKPISSITPPLKSMEKGKLHMNMQQVLKQKKLRKWTQHGWNIIHINQHPCLHIRNK